VVAGGDGGSDAVQCVVCTQVAVVEGGRVLGDEGLRYIFGWNCCAKRREFVPWRMWRGSRWLVAFVDLRFDKDNLRRDSRIRPWAARLTFTLGVRCLATPSSCDRWPDAHRDATGGKDFTLFFAQARFTCHSLKRTVSEMEGPDGRCPSRLQPF